MSNIIKLFLCSIYLLLLSACQLEASISDLHSDIVREKSEQSMVAVAPSVQHETSDSTNTYKARSSVGEVTTGVTRDSGSQYKAEVSITFQRL